MSENLPPVLTNGDKPLANRRTVGDCYRQGDPTSTIANLVASLGMYDCNGDGYYWLGDLTDEPVAWMTKHGEVNIDLDQVVLLAQKHAKPFYEVIGWCVANRMPCVLHGETSRRAWRP